METPEVVLGPTLQESPPVILLGRANTYQDGKRLKRVQEESSQITEIFQRSEAVSYQVLKAQPEDGVYLFDQLRHFRFLDTLQVLHIAGFSAGEYFHLEGGWGEEALSPADFAQLLGKLPNLQVVFLSGCATNALLEALLPLNIPLILATQTEHDRRIVEEMATRFYQFLASGSTLRECVNQLEEAFPDHFAHKRVFYQLEQDRFIWDGKGTNSLRQKLEWGGYALEEIEDRLDWHLPEWNSAWMQATVSQLTSPSSGKKKVRWVVALLILLGGISGFGTYAYSYLDWQSWFNFGAPECQFSDPEAFHIAQFPFKEAGNCEWTDTYFQAGIHRRLEKLGEGYEILLLPAPECDPNPAQIQRQLRSCKPEMALWGTYHFSGAQQLQLQLKYLYDPKVTDVTSGSMSLMMPEHLFDEANDFIVSAIEEVVFWVRARQMYEMEEYELALRWLQEVPEREDTTYQRIAWQKARCYEALQDFDLARREYDLLLKIAPDSAQYWYERGTAQARLSNYEDALLDLSESLRINDQQAGTYHSRAMVYLRLNRIEDALQDGQKLLALEPQEANTHGLLAAIYAQMEDKPSLLRHFEQALQLGLNPRTYLTSLPALQAYEYDPQFQQLLREYP